MAVVMYDGSPDERKQLQRDRVEKGTFNVLVTHYDLVMRDKAALRKVCFLQLYRPASTGLHMVNKACTLVPWLPVCNASSAFVCSRTTVIRYPDFLDSESTLCWFWRLAARSMPFSEWHAMHLLCLMHNCR